MSSTDLYNQKWQKLLKRAWLFRFIPFADFVFVAGSMVMGNAGEDSDFDVIVGCRQGRIFTARFSCWFVFSLFGLYARHPVWAGGMGEFNRTNKTYQPNKSYGSYKSNRSYADKFCFSHFVTPAAYRLSPPHNEYWKNLYQSLVPVYGDPEIIQKFYNANADWAGPVRNSPPKGSFGPRLRAGAVSNGINKKLVIIKTKEWFLGGHLGNLMEKIFKKIQIKKIERRLADIPKYNPRIIYNDNELEFHPDTKRIEEFVKNFKK